MTEDALFLSFFSFLSFFYVNHLQKAVAVEKQSWRAAGYHRHSQAQPTSWGRQETQLGSSTLRSEGWWHIASRKRHWPVTESKAMCRNLRLDLAPVSVAKMNGKQLSEKLTLAFERNN